MFLEFYKFLEKQDLRYKKSQFKANYYIFSAMRPGKIYNQSQHSQFTVFIIGNLIFNGLAGPL